MRRRWQPDTLAVRDNIFDTPCRVCGGAIAKGEKIHGFAWREERGRAHISCGWYTLEDAEAVKCARQLMALRGLAVPRSLVDDGVMLYLVRRVHQVGIRGERVMPTTIGVALFERIKRARLEGSMTPLTDKRVQQIATGCQAHFFEVEKLAKEVLQLREDVRALREATLTMLRAANTAEHARQQLERDSRRGPAAHLAPPPTEVEVGPRLESRSKEGG